MQTPLVHIKKFALLYGVFISYLVGGLTIGEFHPFSRYPMYNNLPNWSYVFYFVDEQNKLVPAKRFGVNGGTLGHLFSTIAEHHKIGYGNGSESKLELTFIGEKMMNQIIPNNHQIKDLKKIKLIRIYYRIDENKSIKNITCMYEKNVE